MGFLHFPQHVLHWPYAHAADSRQAEGAFAHTAHTRNDRIAVRPKIPAHIRGNIIVYIDVIPRGLEAIERRQFTIRSPHETIGFVTIHDTLD